ncbi:MAG: NPN-dependent hydroxyacid isomerase, LarAH14/15/16 family, partial [Planctomycetota bacterium]
NHPEGCDPLFTQLKPGMKVTIAIDDISLPLPSMQRPDVRQLLLEAVIEQLAAYGVTDVELVIALALHRRMTAAEIKHAVGDTIFDRYYPDKLYNHDAEDPDGMAILGETAHGETVQINRRAVESDLVIYVNLNLVPMDGGHKSVAVGLTGYAGLRGHHNPKTILDSMSYMDPEASAMHRSCTRQGTIVNKQLNVFTVETTVNNKMYGGALSFLGKDEDDWTKTDEFKFKALQKTLQAMPRAAKRAFFHKYRAPYGVTSVQAGETEAVHKKTLDACFRQYAVPVEGQSDVLIAGVPYLCPYNVNSIMNPLLVHCSALGYLFNLFRGKPLVKKDGVLIVCHPLYDEFHPEHHAPYVEFFHRLLPETRDSETLRREHEERFAKDPAYIHMYRKGHAYHGAHPFYMWYWGENGRAHVGKVIIVNPESTYAAEVLGWEPAKDLTDAIAKAEAHLAKKPSITLLHAPPIFLCDVS